MTLTLDTYSIYGRTYRTYRYSPDASLEAVPDEAIPVADLPDLDLTSTARRLLGAIRSSGLPWDLALSEEPDGGPAVDLQVHHLTGKWSFTRWAWHHRRFVRSPYISHMSPAEAHRRLPAAIAANRREYHCRGCGAWARWTLGRTRQGTSPDCAGWWTTGRALPNAYPAQVFICPTCDTPAVVDESEFRDPAEMKEAIGG